MGACTSIPCSAEPDRESDEIMQNESAAVQGLGRRHRNDGIAEEITALYQEEARGGFRRTTSSAGMPSALLIWHLTHGATAMAAEVLK